MRRLQAAIPLAGAAILLGCLAVQALWTRPRPPTDAASAQRPPAIRPDYADVVIPPNIAPLNFTILEAGRGYYVRLSGRAGRAIEVHSDQPAIVLPAAAWRGLLRANRGQGLAIDVHVQGPAGRWQRFEPIRQTVAAEEIDPYLVYRLIGPLYNLYTSVMIYQRNLETYRETPVVDGRMFRNGCVNCHTGLNHGPENFLVHIRGATGSAMLLAQGGRIRRVDTRTKFNPSPASYTCWHPSGQFVTFSANKLVQFVHAVGETRDVFDSNSDLGCYDVASGSVRSSRQITQRDRLETFPNWSPDGRTLYFSSAPATPRERYRQVQYDLMQIRYDPASRKWGPAELILPAQKLGKSIVEPRCSPDGRYVMLTVCDYGSFPPYQPSSDLYLLDTQAGTCEPLPINSPQCDSWHCWSSNGRWFVFSSKRRDGLLAKPYFSYFDAAGKAHKPFVLPQEDPDAYESFVKNYNVPELLARRIELGPKDFARAALSGEPATAAHAVTGATPKAYDGSQ
jgi:dipeptidyl aminopeptidase/acylaminoacyl peptidase